MPDLLSADRAEIQGDSCSRTRRSELSSELHESDAYGVRYANPCAGSCCSQGINDVAGEGAGNVQAGEWAELFERDFVVERGLNAQRAHEHAGKHGAIGHGFDCEKRHSGRS